MAAPTFVTGASSGVDTTNVSSVTVTLGPTAFADGDTVYIAVASDAASQSFTAPTGFTTVYSNVDIPATTPTATFALFKKANIVKANEDFDGVNYDFYIPVSTAERHAWFCWAVSGDGGIDSQGTNQTGSSATATLPGITTLTNDCLVISLIAADQVATPMGLATGYNKVGEISGASAASLALFWRAAPTAGSIGSVNVSIANEQWLGVAFAIKATATSYTLTPSPASAAGATLTAATVKGAVGIANKLAQGAGATLHGAIVKSGVSLAPSPAIAKGATQLGAVIKGAIAITSKLAQGRGATVVGAVVRGSSSTIPSPATGRGATLTGAVVKGSISRLPSPAQAAGATQIGTVLRGSAVATPSPATARGATFVIVFIVGAIVAGRPTAKGLYKSMFKGMQ